jgi:type IV secretion system protein TrbI
LSLAPVRGIADTGLLGAIPHLAINRPSSQVGEQVVGHSLNVQSTITIRPGFPVRIIVNRDLVLEPYAG